MIKKKAGALLLMAWLMPVLLLAQATENERKYTAFDMRSNGKIFVVVVVVCIILAGLILYLIRLDSKISKLEKEK
jgi:NhaP-type Na+/H+ or K+/H+ antiporter